MPTDNRLDDLLDRWEQLGSSGKQVDPRDLCEDSHLLPDFLAQIEALRRIDAILSTEGFFPEAGGDSQTVPTHAARARLATMERTRREGKITRTWPHCAPAAIKRRASTPPAAWASSFSPTTRSSVARWF